MSYNYIWKIVQNVWKQAVFLGLTWLIIQYLLALIIILLTVFKTIDESNQLILFAQFFLMLLSIMFPVITGNLATKYFPFSKVKKATRLKVGLISGIIFGAVIGIFTILFSTTVFLFASAITGILLAQAKSFSIETIASIFGLYIIAISVFVTTPLTMIFGAIYGSIGGILKENKILKRRKS